MLTLKSHENKKPIIAIKNKSNKKTGEVFLLPKVNKEIDGFEELELDDDHSFQILPDQNKERDCLYVAGQAGSGKSFFCKQYLKEYIKLFPKNPIFLFSYLDEDDTIDEIKVIQRIDIYDKEFLNEELDPKDFKNSLIILDDMDCVEDKKIKNKVLAFFKKLLQIGRRFHTTVIWACHEIVAGYETKCILGESHSITFFPKTIGTKKMKYVCDSYLGMDKEEIEKIKRLDSRAVTVLKTYPKVVVSEKEIFII